MEMELFEGNYELDIDPKKVCRLCLSQATNMINIFSSSIVDGYIISIPEMLAFTVDITVTTDDKLPTKICTDCKKQIVSFHTFKRKTKRTDELLLSMFASEMQIETESVATDVIPCPMCDAVFENDDAYIEHAQQEHHDVDVYELENESNKVLKPNIKEQEIEVCNIDMMGNYEDSTDGDVPSDSRDVLATDEELTAELKSTRRTRATASKAKETIQSKAPKSKRDAKHSEKPSTSKIVYKTEISDIDDNVDMDINADDYEYQTTGSESNAFHCPMCVKKFADKSEFIEHCKEHEHDGYQCDDCNEFFIDVEQWCQHECELSDKNVNEEDLICVPCNKRMKSTSQLRQHKKMHDSMNLIIHYLEFFPCHDCCLVFISKETLNEHNAEAHTEKVAKDSTNPSEKIDDSCTDYQFLEGDMQTEYKEDETYSCGECAQPAQQYQSIDELKYHVILHANKFECPIEDCGCQYDQISRLSIHVLNKHINTKNLQCLHCSQAFQTYDDLQMHLKVFCKEKKFKCHECDKKFFSKKALTTHLRTLQEKRFKCKLCSKSFKQQGELTIHVRSHTNERPFQCTICNKSYKTSSMRAAHMDSHISGKTFECTLCDKKLQSRTSYRNHMKRHTEEKKHECEYCSKRFFTKYHLKLHQSKIHKGLTESSNSADLADFDGDAMIVFET